MICRDFNYNQLNPFSFYAFLIFRSPLNLLGVWASKPYIEEFFIYEKIHHENFDRNTVIVGDFNSNAIWDKQHGDRNHSAVVKALEERGLVSAYHYWVGEEAGKESEPTFLMYRDKERPYHIDYCFCDSKNVRGFKILNDSRFLTNSDHLPIEIVLSESEKVLKIEEDKELVKIARKRLAETSSIVVNLGDL